MTAPIIQANYEQLDEIAKRFGQQAEMQAELNHRVAQRVDALRGGGWVGQGVDAFLNEMDGEVFPALTRLTDAFTEAQSVTLTVKQIIWEAEHEAAGLFDLEAAGDSGKQSPQVDKPLTPEIKPYKDGAVPLYMLDMDDPNFDPKSFVQNIETNGRPVLFMLHGFKVDDEAARNGYSNASEWYSEQYKHLPESQRPIIIGVDWDSHSLQDTAIAATGAGIMGGGLLAIATGATMAVVDYRTANSKSTAYGQRFGKILEQFNRFHPESSVNVVAHSLGNRMFMEAVRSSDVSVDNYLAVQAAVDYDQIAYGGRFEDMLDLNEVGRMGVTYSSEDRALKLHDWSGYDEALGRNPSSVTGRHISTYNLEGTEKGLLRHHDFDGEHVRPVALDFFGKNGEGFHGNREYQL